MIVPRKTKIEKGKHKYLWLFLMITFSLSGQMGCSKSQESNDYQAKVNEIVGHHLFLNDEKKEVALIGVYVPISTDDNYLPELERNLHESLKGKEILVKTKVKKHPQAFPKIDLVEVFLNGVNINKKLLRSGEAFFFENYWNPKEKEEYRMIEQKARVDSRGLWKEKDKLIPLSVRKKNTRFAYHPESPEVKNLPQEEKVIYYTPLPYQDRSIMRAVFDDFSMARWLNEEEKAEVEEMKKTGWDQLKQYRER